MMKPIAWNGDKNEWRKAERGVSFEAVVLHTAAGDIIETLEHPNQSRYPGQQIHVIAVEDYLYLVPFIESEDEVFLKTIMPTRKAMKKHSRSPT